MDNVFYVIAILCCGDSGAGCAAARTVPVRYESATACRAAASNVLMDHTDLDYPVLRADCRKAMQPARAKAQARAR